MLRRGGGESLHGEVGDAVERQVHQLTPEVVLVEVAEEGLVSELDDGVDQVAGGLVLQENQEWTKRQKNISKKQFTESQDHHYVEWRLRTFPESQRLKLFQIVYHLITAIKIFVFNCV